MTLPVGTQARATVGGEFKRPASHRACQATSRGDLRAHLSRPPDPWQGAGMGPARLRGSFRSRRTTPRHRVRRGAAGGARMGSSRRSRIAWVTSGGWLAASSRMRPPQRGRSSTSTAKTRRRSSAQASRRVRRACSSGSGEGRDRSRLPEELRRREEGLGGHAYCELRPLDVPYNLQDLSITSHSPQEREAGRRDPIKLRFEERIESGFQQLAQQSEYIDLPAYHYLRNLGSEYSGLVEISGREEILLLCPFEDDYTEKNLDQLMGGLSNALTRKKLNPAIRRNAERDGGPKADGSPEEARWHHLETAEATRLLDSDLRHGGGREVDPLRTTPERPLAVRIGRGTWDPNACGEGARRRSMPVVTREPARPEPRAAPSAQEARAGSDAESRGSTIGSLNRR